MIVRVREWYAGRSTREQRLLLVMLAIAMPLLVWLAVVQPLGEAYDEALREQLEAVDRHGRVLALADSAKTRQSVDSRSPAAVDLQLLVTESASQAGIALQAVNPSGTDSVDVTIEGASAIAVAQWLRGLEARAIAADELRMTPRPDGTVGTSVRLVRAG